MQELGLLQCAETKLIANLDIFRGIWLLYVEWGSRYAGVVMADAPHSQSLDHTFDYQSFVSGNATTFRDVEKLFTYLCFWYQAV